MRFFFQISEFWIKQKKPISHMHTHALVSFCGFSPEWSPNRFLVVIIICCPHLCSWNHFWKPMCLLTFNGAYTQRERRRKRDVWDSFFTIDRIDLSCRKSRYRSIQPKKRYFFFSFMCMGWCCAVFLIACLFFLRLRKSQWYGSKKNRE